MKKEEEQALKNLGMRLRKELVVKGHVMDALRDARILGDTDEDEILHADHGGRKDMASALLKRLPSAGKDAFTEFVEALRNDERSAHNDLAKDLAAELGKLENPAAAEEDVGRVEMKHAR